MTSLTPSQFQFFEEVWEQMAVANTAEQEKLLLGIKDPRLGRLVRLGTWWKKPSEGAAPTGRSTTLDVANLPHGLEFPGFILGGKIGEGTFGAVYHATRAYKKDSSNETDPKASPIRLDRVAIKFRLPGFGGHLDDQMYLQELAHLVAAGTVRDPGLVQYRETGKFSLNQDGKAPFAPFLVMEDLDGLPVDVHVQRFLSHRWQEKAEFFAKVCAAVHAAHRAGFVHGDLKPANILVTRDGQPVVLDYGLAARLTPFAPLLSLGGTLEYSAPEQLEDLPTVSIHSDVYSLGVILFQILTGKLPYPISPGADRLDRREEFRRAIRAGALINLRDAQTDLPKTLADIVAKALKKSEKQRYATPAHFAEALNELVHSSEKLVGSDELAKKKNLAKKDLTSPKNQVVIKNSHIGSQTFNFS